MRKFVNFRRSMMIRDYVLTIHAMEYTSGDETCKSSGENVTGIENGDTRRNLLASVEDSEKVHSSRVVRSFCNTEEEADKQKTDEIVTDGGQGRYDGPQCHTDAHVV